MQIDDCPTMSWKERLQIHMEELHVCINPILVNRGTQGKLGQLKILDSRALFFLSSFD